MQRKLMKDSKHIEEDSSNAVGAGSTCSGGGKTGSTPAKEDVKVNRFNPTATSYTSRT
jgi:hypothetical protein